MELKKWQISLLVIQRTHHIIHKHRHIVGKCVTYATQRSRKETSLSGFHFDGFLTQHLNRKRVKWEFDGCVMTYLSRVLITKCIKNSTTDVEVNKSVVCLDLYYKRAVYNSNTAAEVYSIVSPMLTYQTLIFLFKIRIKRKCLDEYNIKKSLYFLFYC